MRRRLIEEKIIRGVKSSVSCEKDELILAESSGVMPDSIAIKGGSFQQTYEGYNLLDTVTNQDLTSGDVTCNVSNNEITLNGDYGDTTNITAPFTINKDFDFEVEKTYSCRITHLSGEFTRLVGVYLYGGKGTAYRANFGLLYSPNESIVAKFTMTEEDLANPIQIRVAISASYTNAKFHIEIVEGSYTSSTFPAYEPYVGGISSPNAGAPIKSIYTTDIAFPDTYVSNDYMVVSETPIILPSGSDYKLEVLTALTGYSIVYGSTQDSVLMGTGSSHLMYNDGYIVEDATTESTFYIGIGDTSDGIVNEDVTELWEILKGLTITATSINKVTTGVTQAYPQPIQSAGDSGIYVELKGVNLLEYGDVTATCKGTYTQIKATKFAVKPNTKYTICFDYEIIENTFTRVMFSIGQGLTYYATDIEYGASLPNLTSGTFTYTFKTKIEKTTTAYPYLYFRVRRPESETGAVTMTISNLMLVEGDEALPYEPYVEPVSIEIPNAFTLDNGSNIPLSFAEANGAKDTLIIDKARNKVEYIQKVANFTFNDGGLYFYNYLNPSSKVRYLSVLFSNYNPFKTNRAKGYCSHEHSSRFGTASGISHEMWVGINRVDNNLYWVGALDFLGFTSHIVDRDNITTEEKTIALSQFREWLDAQKANGNPFTVVYEIPKEQWITYDLTSSDFGKELLKIKLPKNTAIITATGKNGVDIQGIDATYYTMNLENSDMQELIIECIDEQGNVIDAKYHLVRRDSVFKALAPKIEGYEA
ncbi:MAG: hypothetical protein IJW54_07730, partial [Clostridia bacterium]|nr:hypothetical protein [Clostridia bacterium]